jgi:antitoxin (DNA-binding transcriptional repressor) of toxin-antitoxin stability system
MKVSAQYAEEHLTDILNAADGGEDVEIARPDQPTYRLTLVKSEPAKPKAPPHTRSRAWQDACSVLGRVEGDGQGDGA